MQRGKMYVVPNTRPLAFFLLVVRLAVCKWTFSLRISVDQCCSSPTAACGKIGTCDDLLVGMCFRRLGYTQEDRHNCRLFIAGNSSALFDRGITPEDEVNAHWMVIGKPFVDALYEGGIQLHLALLTTPDLPPFSPDMIVIDRWFVELERVAGDSTNSAMNVTGMKGNAAILVSLHVECYDGYSGDDCGCEEDMECATTDTTTDSPTVTPSQVADSPTVTPSQGAVHPTETSSSLVVPVSAAGGGLVLLLLILTILAVLCFIYRRRRDRKSHRLKLSHLQEAISVEQPLPPTIPPNDVVDDGVTYSSIVHKNESNGHYDSEQGEEVKVDLSNEQSGDSEGLVYADLDHSTDSPSSSEKGLVYADLDHDRATYSTFRELNRHKHKPPPSQPSQGTTAPATEYAVLKPQKSHKYMNVPRPKPRKRQPPDEPSVYSTLPATT